MRLTRAGLAAVTLLAAAASTAGAQSRQRFSIQGSGAVVRSTDDELEDLNNETRLGVEGQLRYTLSRLSVGVGWQYNTVFVIDAPETDERIEVVLQGAFVEPRFVLTAFGPVAPYLAGRVGYGELVADYEAGDELVRAFEKETMYGGGGGLLIKLTNRLSLDVGAQYFVLHSDRSEGFVMGRLGASLGLF